MTVVVRQGTRVYSSRSDLYGHVSNADGISSGFVYVKWEPPYDQELPTVMVPIEELQIVIDGGVPVDQVIDKPIEAPALGITDEQKKLIEEDPFKPSNLLNDNGYVVHDVYDSAAENDLGAALMGLLDRCITQTFDPYIKANAEHVRHLMGMAMQQQEFLRNEA